MNKERTPVDSSAWEPEVVPPRNKVLGHIASYVKQGVPRDELEKELPRWLKDNQIELPDWDIWGMLDWAYRKFSPPKDSKNSTGK